ncbi:tungsten ABC transporter substrate-binding protein [candidate division WOR-1 bacterium RIFOXYB2_FULL_42_35]|uniref:Tungsten ABC transporter substrate-binding protein n=1 Tax=candidate division WOR-1 bacterium RIFOXYC2_FULL_41_25 TaxID=1802586 RepID=A0A1F4TN72_UNCSA|nr:MAG: tungsten ABC transporter substrate-binding protein [candidate division WOR-1 bacterium RIFOXYA2_FULL_41_14]OGC24666.1 MAG: tungsten ABC transporter substrate-binding protein [candidate division WOR-1 bacterium RIFOXYB2_FULL_42_35]OGC34181.1 MAG: tungsten ABC transporter substrate-binding protein [candidate division WOR-1 bacterium RIFOXYC2_FULL_41_25]OGC42457.1 MAG: tungsten ABC transporter substrate-binding protein [candidate division WOR-1 bacterium RIFOXYD2_FULL_41_8]
MKRFLAWLLLVLFLFSAPLLAASKSIILATTTSTVDSGLLDVLIPIFEKQTGYKVLTIGVGSGMAMAMGKRGEADVLLVHSPKAEEALVAGGFGINRRAVMHNDFVLLGPLDDPAGVKSLNGAKAAFGKIASGGVFFISRGDKSGTHAKELSVWPAKTVLSNLWYLESGQGMGATLMIASQKKAYTLSDRATYLSFKDKVKLVILSEGDTALLNPYHVIEVNPAKFTKVNAEGARAFSDFIVSPAIQKVIAEFGKEQFGGSLFFPDAK